MKEPLPAHADRSSTPNSVTGRLAGKNAAADITSGEADEIKYLTCPMDVEL